VIEKRKKMLTLFRPPVTGGWQPNALPYGMAHWMAEHEVLSAAIFVGASLALTTIFAAMERRKNYFS
jgi:hypothetical protein